MALHPLRLRRTLTTLTSLHRILSVPNPKVPSITASIPNPISYFDLAPPSSFSIFQSRWFRSSGSPLSSPRQYKLYKEGDEITEDTVLFEGCDYNHWLIVVDFPKDNKPPPEEMVRTYENICAQGLGVSVEEARKRIYACSTSTYEGFQVLMSEEESEKFNDVPGVVFVLPDSYIDPVNKEYGGDKYENGVITERRPPPQYGRSQGGRFRQNNPPQQNYRQQPPTSNLDYAPRGPDPSYQGSYNQGGQGNYNSGQRKYMPPEQRGFAGDHRNYNPSQVGNKGQGPNPGYGQNFEQGVFRGDHRNYAPSQGGNNGQRPNPGYGQNFDQRDFRGDHRNYAPSQGGNNGQGPNPGYGQKFEQRGFRGDHMNYAPSQGGNNGQGPNPGYGRNFDQRDFRDHRNYAPSQGGNIRQGPNPGYGQNFEQRDFGGDCNDYLPSQDGNYQQGPNPVYGQSYEQRANPSYEQNFQQGSNLGPGHFRQSSGDRQTYPGHGAGQGFPHGEQRNEQWGNSTRKIDSSGSLR